METGGGNYCWAFRFQLCSQFLFFGCGARTVGGSGSLSDSSRVLRYSALFLLKNCFLSARLFERHWKLFGLVPLWKRRFLIDNFVGISFQIHPAGVDDSNDIWFVGFLMKSRNKRLLPVQWFETKEGTVSIEAKDFANRLAEMTKLPVISPS